MADNKDIPAYPFMFSADQWLNKFSPFQGQPIPSTQYSGVPTDALGRPIQSYLDAQSQAAAAAAAAPPAQASPVTLNTNPVTGTPLANNPYLTAQQKQNIWNTSQPQGIVGYSNLGGKSGDYQPLYGPTQLYQAQQAAAPAAAAAPVGPDMNAAYLAALSNPRCNHILNLRIGRLDSVLLTRSRERVIAVLDDVQCNFR